MIESLGSTNKQPLVTEETMWRNIKKIIDEAPGRIIIATFSTQVKRIRDILIYAHKIGKKVAIDGYSMKMIVEVARKMGYIKIGEETIIDVKRISDYPPNKLIIICTGAQGEPRAVLSRIVSDAHPFLKLKKTDTIIFSSSIVPGNERTIQYLKDNLYRKCDNIIHNEIMDVHVSGHNNIEAIQEIVRQIKPTYILPVYANHYFLKESAKVIKKIGFPENNIFVLDDGNVIKFDGKNLPVIEKEKVDTHYIFIDGLGIGDVGEIVIRDRQMLAKDGMFVIVAIVDKATGAVRGSPDIISRGFVYLRESKDLLKETRKRVINIVNSTTGSGGAVNWSYVKDEIRNKIGQFLFSKTQRRPIILPVVIEV
jgi:ribonuclease J